MNIKYNKALWLIIILAIVMMIPFLGLTDFNTKGEPREAVVAYTMLEHGNWILPINNGGDIPYKPPFFHWCIAFFSLFIGHVNEYTSRLPSAVSLVLMTIGGFVFYAKRKNAQTSLIAAILTLTAFEVHRAGMNCRVDMLNTAFMVGAMYLLYRWWEKGKHQLPWLAILCMSGATLTKGPVGIILPCFVMGVFMLTQRENFWGIVWRMALTALLSLIIPFCWYYAAYLQGGDEFLRLVKEENIDRFMGKMAYESHENPAWYNLLTLITGWLPYTLLLLFSLFILPWKKFSKTRFLENAKKATPLQVFTWLAFLLVLFFYCIPKSKRSVYLLPCYPFMAYLIAEYIVWMMKEKMGALKVYAGVIASITLILNIALLVVKKGWVPESIFHGKHAIDNIAMLHALENNDLLIPCSIFMVITLEGVYLIFRALKKKNSGNIVSYTLRYSAPSGNFSRPLHGRYTSPPRTAEAFSCRRVPCPRPRPARRSQSSIPCDACSALCGAATRTSIPYPCALHCSGSLFPDNIYSPPEILSAYISTDHVIIPVCITPPQNSLS